MTNQSSAERIYANVKKMAEQFEIKPDEKLNEMTMAKSLGASRTPLREALNRLVSEGFLTFEKGRGFFGRSLSATKILDLFQAREAIEGKLVELACERATNKELSQLSTYLGECEAYYERENSADYRIEFDEKFHMAIAKMSGNLEMIKMLENLNARLRFVRTFDLEKSRITTSLSHREILNAIEARNTKKAAKKMRAHIIRSHKDTTKAVKKAYAKIYVPEGTPDEN